MKILEIIKNSWFVLVFVSGMIVTWANFQNTLSAHEARLDDLETQRAQELEILQEIRIDVELTKRDVTYIKERL
jgi:hypothetical protein